MSNHKEVHPDTSALYLKTAGDAITTCLTTTENNFFCPYFRMRVSLAAMNSFDLPKRSYQIILTS